MPVAVPASAVLFLPFRRSLEGPRPLVGTKASADEGGDRSQPVAGGGEGGARPGEAVAASGKERINQSRTRRRKGFDIFLFFLARLAKGGETQNAENIDEERIARRWRPLRPRVPRPSSAVQKGR